MNWWTFPEWWPAPRTERAIRQLQDSVSPCSEAPIKISGHYTSYLELCFEMQISILIIIFSCQQLSWWEVSFSSSWVMILRILLLLLYPPHSIPWPCVFILFIFCGLHYTLQEHWKQSMPVVKVSTICLSLINCCISFLLQLGYVPAERDGGENTFTQVSQEHLLHHFTSESQREIEIYIVSS